jgi:hypothetical protein
MRMVNMMKRNPRAQIPADENCKYDERKPRAQIPADEDGKYDDGESQGPNTCR